MACMFDEAIFDSAIFDVCVVSSVVSGGGIPWMPPVVRRTKQDIARERERFGIPDREAAAIRLIAERQARELETDSQKRFDELRRELELQSIEWNTKYLDYMNDIRERLINEEISSRIKRKLQDDDDILIIILAASV